MKILMINVVCGIRSTGRICTDLAEALEAQGHEVKIAYGREYVPNKFQKYAIRIGTDIDVKLHGVKARFLDGMGFGSKNATEKFIKWVKEYDPDIIHLHNIHGYYLNIEVLFDYIRHSGKRVLWSLYDCWSITGHCAHFDYNCCNKWKSNCKHCTFRFDYPKTYIDCANKNYKRKKELFTGIRNLVLICPSKWINDVICESYLKDYKTELLPNGIDLLSFTHVKSNKKNELGIERRKMVLGVSSFWNKLKGIEYMIYLANNLDRDIYSIVLVGKLPNNIHLPDTVIHIENTDSIKELCEYYSAADVFVNPTLQETQGLTSVEALACGTPVVVFDSGGAAECVSKECGIIVKKNDEKGLLEAVEMACTKGMYKMEQCIKQAQKYEKNTCYAPFIELYENN